METNNKEKAHSKKPVFGKIGDIIGNILLTISLLVIGSVAVTFVVNDFDYSYSSVFGYRFAYVLSASMEPTLDTHSTTVMKVNAGDYKTGDIIVYKQKVDGSKIHIIHRIIDKTDEGFITKGDNNPERDPWIVSEDQVIGRVVHVMNWTAPIMDFVLGGNK